MLGISNGDRAEEHIDRPYTGMDEEGNIYAVESESGLVDETVTTYADEAQVVNFNTKGSASVTEYTEAYTGNAGYTNGGYGADAAYLGTENGKVKFMLSGVVGYVNQDQVQIVKKSSAKSISHYKVSDGWIVHALTYNMNQTNYAETNQSWVKHLHILYKAIPIIVMMDIFLHRLQYNVGRL